MKNAIRLSVAVLLIVIAAVPAASTMVNPDVVKGTSLFEGYGAATHIGPRRLFAWSNESGRNGDRLIAFAETNGGTLTRLNPPKTEAFVGGYDQGTDHVVYQQVRGNESNLFRYDVGNRARNALSPLNDGFWQWNPSIDTRRGTMYIAYGVNRFGSPDSKWRFFIWDSNTGKRVLLDETTNRCGCLFPGTVAYPWVTWAIGEEATAWRYDLRTGERMPVLPTDRDEYGITVTPDGTTYVAQGGDRCGAGAQLYRVDPDGTPFLLHEFPDGREASNLSLDFTGERDRLYFDRRVCDNGTSDILRLRRAESVGEPARMPARGDGGVGAIRRSGASSGARPRTR